MQDRSQEEQQKNDVFIFKKMLPTLAEGVLRKHLSQNEDDEKVWLIRESRVPGMITVQHMSREEMGNEKAKYWPERCDRYCLTNEGWELNNDTESPEGKEITARMKDAVNIENASKHVNTLLDQIYDKYNVTNDQQIKPEKKMQTNQIMYCGYGNNALSTSRDSLFSSSEGSSGSLPKARKRKHSDVEITNLELLKLITDPITNKIMSNPVTLPDRTTCDRSSLKDNAVAGKDYYPNHSLEQIIKYIIAAYGSNIDPKTRSEKLQSLEKELQDPITLDFMVKPMLVIKTGRCYGRDSIKSILTGDRTPMDPITREPLDRHERMTPDPTIEKIIKLWPTIEKEVKEDIALKQMLEDNEENTSPRISK